MFCYDCFNWNFILNEHYWIYKTTDLFKRIPLYTCTYVYTYIVCMFFEPYTKTDAHVRSSQVELGDYLDGEILSSKWKLLVYHHNHHQSRTQCVYPHADFRRCICSNYRFHQAQSIVFLVNDVYCILVCE